MKSRLHKFGFLFALGLCSAFSFARAGTGAGASDVIPYGFTVQRYSPLWQRSPFTIASTEQAPTAPGFAQNMAVVAIARIGNEDWVTLMDRGTQERFSVGTTANDQGIKVVSVQTDSDPMKTKVTIQKGAEVATVGFDKVLLALTQTPPPPGATAQAQVQQDPNNPNAAVEPPPSIRRRRLPPIPATNQMPPPSVPPPNGAPQP